jgi:TPP-dependent pyruvate/acetoin dehydrogenase alpha subunit
VGLQDAELANLEAEIEREVAEAVEFAENGTWEPIEQLTFDVYTRQSV